MSSRTFSGGLEFGRGRGGRDDSSSSRESSPTSGKRKRSFSPGSDDGDVPPIADDDTPPPAERPLIRQAVAFGGATAGALPTDRVYQATLPNPSGSSFMFLPGQAPPVPKKTTKRKKKNDAYKSQAGRFRLETYPPPSEAPPVQHGAGPHTSAFRGYPDQQMIRAEPPAITLPVRYPSTSGSTLHSDGSASPAPRVPSRSKNTASRNKSGSQNRSSRSETPSQVRIASSSHLPTPTTDYAMSPTASSLMAAKQNYYRRNYDTGQRFDSQRAPPAIPTLPMLDTGDTHGFYSDADSSANPAAPTSSNPPQIQSTEMANASSRKHGARMVTIYAQDIRSGVVDNQLIEVQIPIRPADNPGEGYWADAAELIEQWQRGPARVDGPARVYTLRGKYRQFLLRVSAANVDDIISANVVLRRNLSVDVVVENPPAPGVPPAPPQLPHAMVGLEYQPDDVVDITYRGIPSPPRSLPPPTISPDPNPSPAIDSDHEYSQDDEPPRQQPLPKPTVRVINPPSPPAPAPPSTAVTPDRRRPPVVTAPPEPESSIQKVARARLKLQKKPYDSPCTDDEPDKVQESIRKAVDLLIQKDDKDKWKEYFKLKGRAETASNMVARYRFVRDLLDKYVGKPVPFRSRSDLIIESKHILAALVIEDSDGRFEPNCTETLGLLKLYGQSGERYEDADVLKLMEEKDVAYNAKPIKRLLHLLRDVDKKWQDEHAC